MILSTGILCSNPVSIFRLFSPNTTVQSAGNGKLNKSLEYRLIKVMNINLCIKIITYEHNEHWK